MMGSPKSKTLWTVFQKSGVNRQIKISNSVKNGCNYMTEIMNCEA
jgi:hypothetical protein